MIAWLKARIGQRSPLRLAWHRGKAFLAALRYGFPARKLIVIGVTGTDGKTTTVGMIAHILLKSEKSFGAASTAFYQVNSETRENTSHLTSLNPFDLQKFLRELVTKGCEFAVIEMSSHGLVQGRCSFTWPAVSAVTNTAMESLEYHETMEQYRKDKGIIFTLLRGKGTKVLNGNDESFAMYTKIPSERTIVFFGNQHRQVHQGDSVMQLTDASGDAQSCTATLKIIESSPRSTPYALTLSIPGLFNLENAEVAVACTLAIGISAKQAVEALQSFSSVPGRLEKIDEGQDFHVFVDFTVTPQAYKKVLTTLRSVAGESGRVLVLCSSCGNRMPEKRPEVGRICSELADIVVACEDETYGEDPHAVLEQLWSGVHQDACEAYKIFDRREAISHLFSLAQKGDAVILCGMGPFAYMSKLKGKVPWDEREVAREILRSLKAPVRKSD